jgi:hypothetical protein
LSKTGPGAYKAVNLTTTEKYSMGKSERFKSQEDHLKDYFSINIPSGIGQIPKYLLKSKKET